MKILPKVRPASKGADEGWAVLSTLISGFVVFGGIGWLLDRWWGTHLMVPIGVIVGMALSIYAVVMQFGRPDAAGKEAGDHATSPASAATQTAAAALRTEKALNRARAANRSRSTAAPSPSDGPPPASTRRETECL